jgi:hypothetical protein
VKSTSDISECKSRAFLVNRFHEESKEMLHEVENPPVEQYLGNVPFS